MHDFFFFCQKVNKQIVYYQKVSMIPQNVVESLSNQQLQLCFSFLIHIVLFPLQILPFFVYEVPLLHHLPFFFLILSLTWKENTHKHSKFRMIEVCILFHFSLPEYRELEIYLQFDLGDICLKNLLLNMVVLYLQLFPVDRY